MSNFFNFIHKHRFDIFYSVILLLFVVFTCILSTKAETKSIINHIENKTFDIRQNIISKKKKANEDIVIVTIDDQSYEYLTEKYGDWPIPRNVYADVLDYIEAQNPKFVAFDLLFINSLNRVKGSDEKLINAFKKYPNVFTAINFDNYAKEVRTPPTLDNKLKTEIELDEFVPLEFTNCRQILPEIIEATANIGHINTPKSDDGFIREIPVIVNYNNDSYLYMTMKLAMKYLNENTLKTENNKLILGERKLPLTENAQAILNWYGGAQTYKYVSLWEIIKSMDGENIIPNDTFKDKIVYIGTSVFSLSDIKTVPTSKYIAGVEIHATFLNNIIDNNLIQKAPTWANALICALLAFLAGITVFKFRSVISTVCLFAVEVSAYAYLATFMMEKFNLWLWIVTPLIVSLLVFICSFIVKYLIKSRDFEYTYKLATTDGLTELYNHRFFQEKMRTKIDDFSKNGGYFSLILLDIDFFKKFNDKYGHQAGDAVLKHVAKTLKSCVRSEDYVCRYGGEEMTIILNRANKEVGVMIAKKICETIASKKYELTPDLEVNITVSLGVSTFPQNGRTPTELIEHADKCLYKAKENGRNQVYFIE